MDEEAKKAVEEALYIFQGNTQEQQPPATPTLPTNHQPETHAQEPPTITGTEPGGKKRRWLGIAGLVTGVTSVTLIVMLVMVPLFRPTAIVTIIPTATTVTTGGTVQVAGRALATVTLTQARTVPATGTGHQDAQVARGGVTFYNAAPFIQTIGAGTLLTGGDGIQVVTGQDAVIPAAAMPTEGQATVSAHALQTGSIGNMKASDIYGACCRINVFVANGTFTGGQDARSFQMVTQSDLDNAVNPLKTTITQSINATFQAQLHQGEASAPPDCTTKVTSDHTSGAEATQVSATITATCTAQAYQVQEVQTQVARNLIAAARRQQGNGYSMAGDPQIIVTGASTSGSALTLHVKAQAVMVYQLSGGQLQAIKGRIAGMDKAQATAWLAHQPGVHAVSIEVSGSSQALPQETNAIRCTMLL